MTMMVIRQVIGFGVPAVILLLLCWTGAGAAGPESSGEKDSPSMEMSLPEAINVALRSNRDVKRTYIDRVLNKFDLKVAEAEFGPNLDLISSSSASG